MPESDAGVAEKEVGAGVGTAAFIARHGHEHVIGTEAIRGESSVTRHERPNRHNRRVIGRFFHHVGITADHRFGTPVGSST